jgi:DNA processing protein
MLLTAVGTRHPSEYSRKVADWLCTDLARCNLILCSGCAVGLDAAVHWAAIRQNTPTIAVLASGVDYDYPRENREMKERIVQNGLLLSEYVPGSKPLSFHFHARNRILAGISESVLVLEASTRSGALITANYACEQGKTVFCVPPADLFDKRYGGVVNFMRDGAYPVFNYLDVLYAYYLKYPHRLSLYDDTERSRTTDSLLFAEEKPSRRPCRTKVPAAAAETSEPPASYAFPAEATEPQRRILELLQKGRYTVNAICMELQMSFDEVSILVLEMELSGWIVNVERDTFMLPEGSAC